MEAKYVLAYDIGTTGVKTCLFRIDSVITLLESASMGYHLYTLPDGGAEQDADEWWDAMAQTTKKLFAGSSVKPEDIAGISFCSQMQGVVVVDRDGNALRRPMSYMDQRAKKEVKEGISNGLRHGGATAFWFELKAEDGMVEFVLSDNGKGFSEGKVQMGFGLTAMTERAKALGGEIAFASETDEGVEIKLRLPLDK